MPKLNVKNMRRAMRKLKLCRYCIANRLNIPVNSVDRLLDGKDYPTGARLMDLGLVLGLPYSKMVIEDEDPNAPVVNAGRI